MTRAEELRNDIENLYFSRRYYFGVLAEFEDLGMTHTRDFRICEQNLHAINHNIKRLEEELEKEERREFNRQWYAYAQLSW